MTSRALRRTVSALAGVAVLSACNEQRITQGVQQDVTTPIVVISKTAGDTLTVSDGIQFSVGAADNLGLRQLTIDLTGGFTRTIDSVFTSAVTSVTLPVSIPLLPNTTAGGTIIITATATDGSNNTAIAVDSIFLINTEALTVAMIRPIPGAVSSPGLRILVEVLAAQRTGVRIVGYTTTGVVTDSNSTGFPRPLPDSGRFTDTLLIPTGTPNGTFQIRGFAEDSAGRPAQSSPVTVTVQTVTNDTDPPFVTFTIGRRVEVRDSITVRATDPSGIQLIGWRAADIGTNTTVGGDSTTVGGSLTEASQQYNLNFFFTSFPVNVEIVAFAVDGAGNRGEARRDTAVTSGLRRDTVLVVNGITKRLPAGGTVADAVYNRNLNEVYLTNVELDRVEIFQVTDTTFVPAGIPVGARPWGIALWPQNTVTGANANMVMVANSGGTNISVVDVAGRREIRRHQLPNYLVQFVQTEIDPATGLIKIKIDEVDFSDRPEYVGAVCLPAVGGACLPNEIYAVYSTTPTIDQGIEFQVRGTVRWENLTGLTPQSHFFWEQAEIPPSPESDTLQILVDRGPGTNVSTQLSAACGRTVDRRQVAFAESTFVRNSGDFTHALIGEGGIIEPALGFARAIGYDRTAGMFTQTCTAMVQMVNFSGPEERDLGISSALRVRDFISNTAIPVRSIGVNFNGRTNLIRADSIYVLSEDLRLAGSFPALGANPGMDLNFAHAFDAQRGGTPGTDGGAGNPNDRLVFFARGDPVIDIYDTWFYQRVATVPVRDPIIGPLRAARLASGDQVLVGVTARGVVIVRIPAGVITNPLPLRDGSGQ